MSESHSIDIRRLDGTLILVFLGVMKHEKASVVAEELGLTQSTISHAIGRLRDIFRDPLFLRRPHGLEPTAFARALEPDIRLAEQALSRAFDPKGGFDPGEFEGRVTMSALDYEMSIVIPPFLASVSRVAPRAQISITALARDEALRALDDRRIDLALGFFWDLPQRYSAEPLIEETYVVAARRDHPFLSDPSRNAYLNARHLIVAPGGGLSGIVDTVLDRQGLRRHVAAAIPQFSAAFPILTASDLIATMPSRLVRQSAAAFGLETAAVPIEVRPFSTALVRHRRDDRAPVLDWVAGLLREGA